MARARIDRIGKLLGRVACDSSGAALPEAALTLPMLVTLSFLTWEFSNVFLQHHTVTTGVRDASRYLARAPSSGIPCDGTDANWSTNVGYAKDIAVCGDIPSVGTVCPSATFKSRVPGWTTGNVSVATTAVSNQNGAYGGASEGYTSVYVVTVTSTFTYVPIGILTAFGFTAPAVTVSHAERCIGG